MDPLYRLSGSAIKAYYSRSANRSHYRHLAEFSTWADLSRGKVFGVGNIEDITALWGQQQSLADLYLAPLVSLASVDNADNAMEQDTEARAGSLSKESDSVDSMKRQIDQLKLENQRLHTRLEQERRAANREVARSDQLQSTLDKTIDTVRKALNVSENAFEALSHSRGERVVMSRVYDGAVYRIDNDEVTINYSVDDEVVTQTYEASRFVTGRMPSMDSIVRAYIFLSLVPSAAGEEYEDEGETNERRFVESDDRSI